MANQLDLPEAAFSAHPVNQGVDIGISIGKTVDHRTGAARFAMAAMIQRVDGITGRSEELGHSLIAPQVLAIAVGQHQMIARRPLGQPRCRVYLHAASAGKMKFSHLHRASPSKYR